jgi:hypothetical protein
LASNAITTPINVTTTKTMAKAKPAWRRRYRIGIWFGGINMRRKTL